MKTVLIVDDETDTRFLLKKALAANHYTVKDAATLKQGFELLCQLSPDIVILDINLPDGNGAHHAVRFKTSHNFLILISADNEQMATSYRHYHANAFLQKPFNARQILDLIRELP